MAYTLRSFSFLLAALLSCPGYAEDNSGSAAQVVREVHLKKDPSEDAPSLGRLPRGTILTLKGDRRNGFAEVGVELEQGSVEGWIRIDALNRRARGEDVEEESDSVRIEEEEEDAEPRPRRKKKIAVPQDEGLLLRRDSSFFYGLQAGGNFGILASETTDYMGPGFMAGAHIGFFLDRNIPLRFEVGYLSLSGTAEDDTQISIGFLESSVAFSYFIEQFELFGALSYAYGMNVSNLPTDLLSFEAADFSKLFGGGGIGYQFSLGEVTDLTLRARYMISFGQDPVMFQTFALQFYFSFRG